MANIDFFIGLLEQQLKLFEQAKNCNIVVTDFLRGMSDATETKERQSQNASDNVLNIIQGEDMKNIIKRKDGRFMAHLQIEGKRVYAYGQTPLQAQKKLKNLKKKALTYEKQKQNYTLTEWTNLWLETYKKPFIKLKQYNEITHLLNETNKQLGNFKITQLQSMQIQEFYNTYKTSRKKEKIILYLNACLQKAYELNLINKNPCVSVVKDKKLKFDKKPFTIEEQEQIINAIKGTDIECYILLYLLTGIRRNEINNNITEWVNIETNQLKAINEKQKNNLAEYKFIDLNPNYTKLLLSQKDKFILKSDNVYRKFKKVLDELNIKGHIHTLRHTFATNYYYLGVPEKLISSWLGHKTLNVTQDIYIGITRKNIKERLLKLYNNLLYEF